jgi:hypothetical protein
MSIKRLEDMLFVKDVTSVAPFLNQLQRARELRLGTGHLFSICQQAGSVVRQGVALSPLQHDPKTVDLSLADAFPISWPSPSTMFNAPVGAIPQ